MASHTRTPIRIARTGMVAAASPVATLIGIDILRAGGNALDAAVAVSAALAVLEPQSSPLGGGVIALVWDAEGQKLSALRAVEAGAAEIWLTALETWGTRSPLEAITPAITLAEDGFALSAAQCERLKSQDLLSDELPNTLRPGAILCQPLLARTLKQIAQGGRKALAEDEAAAQRAQITEVARTTYRGVDLAESPGSAPESSLGSRLRTLERVDLAALSPESAEAIHRIAGASKQHLGRSSVAQTAATHCVVDARGNAVAWTSSSGPSEESLAAGPWMLFHGTTLWAVGGDADTQTNLQIVTQLIDSKRSPQEAIESPKWQTAPDGAELFIEDRLPLDTCYELRQRGYALTVGGPWSGTSTAQVIQLDPDTGSLFGGSDPRVEGLALGY